MKKQVRPDSITATLIAVGEISLVLIGLTGLSVTVFRDQGWFQQLVNKLLYTSAGLVLIPFIVLIIYILNRWMIVPDGIATSRGNWPLYLMMAIGAYFLFRLIFSGSL